MLQILSLPWVARLRRGPPFPQTLVVSGAGSAVANAPYQYAGLTFGENSWIYDLPPGELTMNITLSGGYWDIWHSGAGVLYRAADTGKGRPPRSGYSIVNGIAPAPTVSY